MATINRLHVSAPLLMLALGAALVFGYSVVARASLDVLAPARHDLEVQVGTSDMVLVKAGTHALVRLPRGQSLVVLRTAAGQVSTTFDVSSGLDWFVFSAPGQCLAFVDISATYAIDGQPPPSPTHGLLTARMGPGTSRKGYGNLFFPGREPPTVMSEINGRRPDITLVREVPCELLDATDDALLEFLQL